MYGGYTKASSSSIAAVYAWTFEGLLCHMTAGSRHELSGIWSLGATLGLACAWAMVVSLQLRPVVLLGLRGIAYHIM